MKKILLIGEKKYKFKTNYIEVHNNSIIIELDKNTYNTLYNDNYNVYFKSVVLYNNDLTNQEIIIESDRNRKYYIDINYYYNVIDPIIYYNMEIINYMSDITKQYSIVSLSNRIYNMNNLILYVDGLQIDIYKSIIYDYLNIHQTF